MSVYKMVALDLDGTLTQTDGSIPEDVLTIIKGLASTGVRFVLATGRMPEAAERYAEAIGGASIISYNGSFIRKPDGTVIKKFIPQFLVEIAAEYCKVKELYLQMYHDDKICIKEETDEFKSDLDSTIAQYEIMGDFTRVRLYPTPKMVIVAAKEKIQGIMADLRMICRNLRISQSSDRVIEVNPKEVDKGSALSEIAKDLGIKNDEVIAIGDGMNDLSMIEWAGTGVAVNNAPQELREKANLVTDAPSSEGVKEALIKLFY